jgi:hypothetical protein
MSRHVNSPGQFHSLRPPHRLRWLARAFLLLALLVGQIPGAVPVAAAAQTCGYQQTYGPYGARVGTQTPQLILAMTTGTPDLTYIDKTVESADVLGDIARLLKLSPGHVHVDNRPRIDWGDGTGWQTDGVRFGNCAVGFFCVFYGDPHTYTSPGTYTARVQYDALERRG